MDQIAIVKEDLRKHILPSASCTCGWDIGKRASDTAVNAEVNKHVEETGHEIQEN